MLEKVGVEGTFELENEVCFIFLVELFGPGGQGFEFGDKGAGRGLSLDQFDELIIGAGMGVIVWECRFQCVLEIFPC